MPPPRDQGKDTTYTPIPAPISGNHTDQYSPITGLMLGCVRYSLGNYPLFHPLVVYPRYPTLTLVSLEQ